MSNLSRKLSNLKGFKITKITKSVRHGNCFEIELMKPAGKIRSKMVVSCDWIFDSDGNFFRTDDIDYE